MNRQEIAIELIRNLHRPSENGRNCIECSRIICLGTPNGLGSVQYPCFTIQVLNGYNGWPHPPTNVQD